MSECVVRMAMPTKNKSCGMAFDFDSIWYCPVKGRICRQPDNGEIPSWCPIICSIPEGHGRLIDAEARVDEHILNSDGNVVSNIQHTVGGILGDYAELIPTVVPAEGSEP